MQCKGGASISVTEETRKLSEERMISSLLCIDFLQSNFLHPEHADSDRQSLEQSVWRTSALTLRIGSVMERYSTVPTVRSNGNSRAKMSCYADEARLVTSTGRQAGTLSSGGAITVARLTGYGCIPMGGRLETTVGAQVCMNPQTSLPCER